MPTPTKKKQCAESVQERDSRWPFPCSKPATVQRDGKWYCGTHDPERVQAKRKAAENAYQAERDEQKSIHSAACALSTRLGMGQPYYQVSYRTAKGSSGYRRALILTFEEIEKLLSERGEAR